MNSLEIQYFLTIVKYGSFTEAAQALSVSQPAISKQIRQLEAELGCSLFARSGRALSLTEAGQAYHAYFQQCRFQLDLLKNRLEGQKKDGTVIIQVAYFKKTRKRFFKMAPIHHHFELCGMKEKNVVYLFWGMTLVFCMLAILVSNL